MGRLVLLRGLRRRFFFFHVLLVLLFELLLLLIMPLFQMFELLPLFGLDLSPLLIVGFLLVQLFLLLDLLLLDSLALLILFLVKILNLLLMLSVDLRIHVTRRIGGPCRRRTVVIRLIAHRGNVCGRLVPLCRLGACIC